MNFTALDTVGTASSLNRAGLAGHRGAGTIENHLKQEPQNTGSGNNPTNEGQINTADTVCNGKSKNQADDNQGDWSTNTGSSHFSPFNGGQWLAGRLTLVEDEHTSVPKIHP